MAPVEQQAPRKTQASQRQRRGQVWRMEIGMEGAVTQMETSDRNGPLPVGAESSGSRLQVAPGWATTCFSKVKGSPGLRLIGDSSVVLNETGGSFEKWEAGQMAHSTAACGKTAAAPRPGEVILNFDCRSDLEHFGGG